MADSMDLITRGELIRAIQATKRRIPERANGDEALDALAREIESPHECVAAYEIDGGGPCQTCGEWVETGT